MCRGTAHTRLGGGSQRSCARSGLTVGRLWVNREQRQIPQLHGGRRRRLRVRGVYLFTTGTPSARPTARPSPLPPFSFLPQGVTSLRAAWHDGNVFPWPAMEHPCTLPSVLPSVSPPQHHRGSTAHTCTGYRTPRRRMWPEPSQSCRSRSASVSSIQRCRRPGPRPTSEDRFSTSLSLSLPPPLPFPSLPTSTSTLKCPLHMHVIK